MTLMKPDSEPFFTSKLKILKITEKVSRRKIVPPRKSNYIALFLWCSEGHGD